jgi:uncharacterized protein YbjT (DUF2867 family)
MQGVEVAYYLIHSMRGNENFHERDRQAALNFSQAAKTAGVKRLIYLGGLGDPDSDLSPHLRSRQSTGDALREAGVPVTEFRAAVIVGAGSVSFEMIRYLTERVPVMICPRWVFTNIQPIAVRDALSYLVEALEQPESTGKIIEIGGADVVTYADTFRIYAKIRGLKRLIVPVPVLTPRLSSRWVHLVTPIPGDIARPLIDGLRNEVIVRDDTARQLFPNIKPMNYETAARLALQHLEASEVETTWSDALASSQGDVKPVVLTTHQGMFIEQRQEVVQASPEQVFRTYNSLGGERGWLVFNWAWRLRGVLDRIVGGVGYRQRRRHPYELRIGDPLDFWRVEDIQENRLLRLRAEMKVPGRAWLQFKSEPMENDQTRLVQTAMFAPKGLFGLIYWYGLYPIHGLIFSRMVKKLAQAAEAS